MVALEHKLPGQRAEVDVIKVLPCAIQWNNMLLPQNAGYILLNPHLVDQHRVLGVVVVQFKPVEFLVVGPGGLKVEPAAKSRPVLQLDEEFCGLYPLRSPQKRSEKKVAVGFPVTVTLLYVFECHRNLI